MGDGFSPDDVVITGRTVNLYADDGDGVLDPIADAKIASQVTDADGAFEFSWFATGTYFVDEDKSGGWFATVGPNYYTIDLGDSSVDFPGNDFGSFHLATIGRAAFRDAENDGIKGPAEMGWSDQTITLRNLDNSSVVETVTDSGGYYSFGNLMPGRYDVRSPQNAGWTATTANPAYLVVTSSGQAFVADFGSFPHREIAGRVFLDIAADRTDNWGTDPGLAGWTVFLDANDNVQLDDGELFAVTDSSGGYSFADVPVGTYGLRLEQRVGYVHLSGGAFSGYTVTVVDGEQMTDLDFAVFQEGEVRGQKFADFDGAGVEDPQEPGLPGWSIFVDSNNDGVLNAGEPNAITDDQGNYVLAGVGPGDQLVREVQQFAWTATTHTAPAWDVSFAGSFNSSVGTALAISDLDDATEHVGLSFTFPFVGSNYSDVWISTNGLSAKRVELGANTAIYGGS